MGKKIFADLEYVLEKIKSALAIHNSDEESHPLLKKQIDVLFGYNGVVTSRIQVVKDGYYSVQNSTDNTFPYGYGTVHLFNRGGEKTMVFYPSIKTLGMYFTFYNGITGWQDWIRQPTSDEITDLQSKIDWKNDDFKTESALPSDFENKKTTIFFARTSFNGYPYAIVKVTKYNDNFCIMELIGENSQSLCYRLSNKGAWGKWQSVATTDKIDISLPLASDVVVSSSTNFLEKCNNEVKLKVYAKKDTLFGISSFVIGIIPDGYRPYHTFYTDCSVATNEWQNVGERMVASLSIRNNGEVIVANVGNLSNAKYCCIDTSWYIN